MVQHRPGSANAFVLDALFDGALDDCLVFGNVASRRKLEGGSRAAVGVHSGGRKSYIEKRYAT